MSKWIIEKQLHKDCPWIRHLRNVQHRVLPKYKRAFMYHGSGIRNYLTRDDVKALWYRDRAYDLSKPCLHRKDSRGHYELSNCEFIEFSIHSKEHAIETYGKDSRTKKKGFMRIPR